jgi:hypothetical protein
VISSSKAVSPQKRATKEMAASTEGSLIKVSNPIIAKFRIQMTTAKEKYCQMRAVILASSIKICRKIPGTTTTLRLSRLNRSNLRLKAHFLTRAKGRVTL